MTSKREAVRFAGAIFFGVTSLLATWSGSAVAQSRTLTGPEVAVGQGTGHAFVEVDVDGAPRAVGIALTAAAQEGLPHHMNTTSRCFDKDASGAFEHGECLGDYQFDFAFPAEAQGLGLPFEWAMVNWNPEGHVAPAPPIWGAPHFDIHFYMVEPAFLNNMRPGPCAEYLSCDQVAEASKPLPAAHHPASYIDVGAAVSAMGNHLVDSQDPELADPSLGFSKTFIYGTWGGELIFLEPMVSQAFMLSKTDDCTPIRAPEAFAAGGFYPTVYCVRYDEESATHRVSLEGLVLREGTAAAED